ncbi:Gpi16 subunit, GPI transamidase component-domain-containing protein [Pelagophyceae sp. CCMP2097]|nr:Gpi16 subunit, GPI transamidase component-domain-containing protein [Pelagophyceae sp. CCMP2097]
MGGPVRYRARELVTGLVEVLLLVETRWHPGALESCRGVDEGRWSLRDRSVWPRALLDVAGEASVARASFAVTHGQWDAARWGAPRAPHGPAGAHAAATFAAANAPLENRTAAWVRTAHQLRSTMSSTAALETHVREPRRPTTPGESWRSSDGDEALCGHHVSVWLRLLAPQTSGTAPFDPRKAQNAIFASLVVSLESAGGDDEGGWVWRHSAVFVFDGASPTAASLFEKLGIPADAEVEWPDAEWPATGGTVDAVEPTPALSAALHVASRSRHAGAIRAFVTNSGPCAAAVRLSIAVPDIVVLLPTLSTAELRARETVPFFDVETLAAVFEPPPPDRVVGPPHVFTVDFVLEPFESARFSLEYVARYLPAAVWPPDQYRGFSLPPISADGACDGAETRAHAFSASALLSLPEADFSMPFNVVTLVSTLIAFFFGTMVSKLVRRKPKRRAAPANDDGDAWEAFKRIDTDLRGRPLK